MRKLTISTLILVALLLTFCGNLFAENNYELSDPEYKTFIVEQLYPYRISYYDDNSTVAFLNSYESANNDAPEDTLISLYSAMRNKNYNWFLSNWKKSDIDKFLDKDDKEGRDPEFYYQLWDRYQNAKSIKLISRIVRHGYVYIGFKVNFVGKWQDERIRTMVLERVRNKWLATNDAVCDPVLAGWKDPDQRNKVPGEIDPDCLKVKK